jgi:hypothetical protein
MSRAIYEALIQGMAERFGVDPTAFLSEGLIAVDGVQFELRYCESLLEDFMLVVCNFGEVAAGPFAQSLAKLLEVNLYLADSDVAASFAMDPGTGNVLLCFRMPLFDLTFDYLYETMMAALGQAQAWRRGEVPQVARP